MRLPVAKRVKEVAVSTHTARMKLAPRHKPYFRLIAEGLHLGYRRSTVANRAGSWLVRRYLEGGAYETQLLGTADDSAEMQANGRKVLTFDLAQSAAREWARAQIAASRSARRESAVETVRTAIAAYVSARSARDPQRARNAELRLGHHVLSAPLADVPLFDLIDKHFADWRRGLKRGGRGKIGKDNPLASSTLARLLNDLRAALTANANKAKAPSDILTTIKEGLRPPKAADRVRAKQVLSDADVRKIVDTADHQGQDFGALVLLLAMTGSRFDQLARATVGDFQPDARRIMVPVSRKGHGDKQLTLTAVPLPDDVVTRISNLTAGRAGHEPLLLRWHHRQIPGDPDRGIAPSWERAERRPWKDASAMTRLWKITVKATGLPQNLVPYCLRHSSIVRMLRAGLPVSLVAKVHDTSADMIERHYTAFILDATEELLRRATLPRGSAEVIPMPVQASRS